MNFLSITVALCMHEKGFSRQFPSIRHLIHFFMRTRQPLTIAAAAEGEGPTVLLKGVGQKTWQIAREDVKLGEKLGEGAFGAVKKGQLKFKTGKPIDVAVKCILRRDNCRLTKAHILENMKEARMLRTYQHENIVRYAYVHTCTMCKHGPVALLPPSAPSCSIQS